MLKFYRDHYIIVKDNDEKIIYKNAFLRNDEYLDAEFYKNLGLTLNNTDGTILETQVNFQKFFKEWWRNIAHQNTFVNLASAMQEDVCLSDDAEIIDRLISFKYTKVGRFFTILEDVSKLVCAEDTSEQNKQNNKKYSDNGVVYIEVKYNVNDIDQYYSFIRELNKHKKQEGGYKNV